MISVIICTHNPRDHYLTRVLAALQKQTLPAAEWELILVDNASDKPVAVRFDISWHPKGRHVCEKELGLTPARLRGIGEAKGDILIFVDDDNVLDERYLEQALRIGSEYPFLGAWGGTIRPEFEQEPPEWTRAYWGYLAIREFKSPKWSNNPSDWQSIPIGAGLCVRRQIAVKYAAAMEEDTARRNLGRKGEALLSYEDIDLAITSSEISLGWGNFPSLHMTHLIPKSRLSEKYLLRLMEGVAASHNVFLIRRGDSTLHPQSAWRQLIKTLIVLLRRGPRAARFLRADLRGRILGARLAGHGSTNSV